MGTKMRNAARWLGATAIAGCLLLAGCAGSSGTDESSGASSQPDDEAILESVLSDFEQLAAIPRPSHHEEKVGTFLLQWAQDQGFEAYQDETGNVIFDVPASEGCEHAPLVALQAHMDMVVVSDDPDFDPLSTPITTVRTEETLTADGTSLGADDGIGVATIMRYVSSDETHGPLRAIITVNEEDGLDGANGIDATVVADATYLINLDAETIGDVIVSSAGSAPTTATQDPARCAPTLDSAVSIEIGGLLGGHSGLVIGSGRINAIRAMGDLLLLLEQEGVAFELSSLEGGTAANAVPKSSSALVAIDSQDVSRVSEIAAEFASELAEAYSATDPDVTVSVAEAALPQTVFDPAQQEDVVTFVTGVSNGVITMSQTVEGLVETSSNLGVVQADESAVSAMCLPRSSQEALLDSVCREQLQLAEHCGFSVVQTRSAVPWPPNPDSVIQPLVQQAYQEATGEEMTLSSIHAALESGTFAELNPDLDIISIGPEIHDVHSVDETLYLDSVVPFYRTLEIALAKVSEQEA